MLQHFKMWVTGKHLSNVPTVVWVFKLPFCLCIFVNGVYNYQVPIRRRFIYLFIFNLSQQLQPVCFVRHQRSTGFGAGYWGHVYMKLCFQDKHPSLQLVDAQYKVDDFEKIRLKKAFMAAVFYCTNTISSEYLEQYLFISTRQLVWGTWQSSWCGQIQAANLSDCRARP